MHSDQDIAVRVERLSKRYLLPQKHEEDYSRAPTTRERLKEFFPALMGADETDFFWALRDISFEVRRGEVLGIIGENGSGKSTLLKILAGVTSPTEGTAMLHGRVGSLLEVGTGFHPDLTGRENIFFNGALLGLSTSEIRSKLASIIDFSGIGDFIDVPVKRYSSGMYVRLAYSVAALLDSEILILDEVLAVGDDHFRSKTQDHIRQTTSVGKTILFVSHSPKAVATICDRAIVLEHGRIVFAGTSKEALVEYERRQYVAMPELVLPEPAEEETVPPPADAVGVDGEALSQRADASDSAEDKGQLDEPDGSTTERGSEEEQSQEQKESADGNEAEVAAEAHIAPKAYVDVSRFGRVRRPNNEPPTGVLKWASLHDKNGTLKMNFATGDEVRVRIGFAGLKDPHQTYFCVLVHNSAKERMTTVYSTDTVHPVVAARQGFVECVIPELMLPIGVYSVMIDCGSYFQDTGNYRSEDCVPFSTTIIIGDPGFIRGFPHNEFQGAVHRSTWSETAPTAAHVAHAAAAEGDYLAAGFSTSNP